MLTAPALRHIHAGFFFYVNEVVHEPKKAWSCFHSAATSHATKSVLEAEGGEPSLVETSVVPWPHTVLVNVP